MRVVALLGSEESLNSRVVINISWCKVAPILSGNPSLRGRLEIPLGRCLNEYFLDCSHCDEQLLGMFSKDDKLVMKIELSRCFVDCFSNYTN